MARAAAVHDRGRSGAWCLRHDGRAVWPQQRDPCPGGQFGPDRQDRVQPGDVHGEGPITTTAAEGWPVHAAGPELPARWPKYGPAAGRLGVRSVTAVPLRLPSIQLGVLCCYGDRPMARDDVAAVNVIAGALAPILLRTAPGESLHDLMESPRSVRDNWIM